MKKQAKLSIMFRLPSSRTLLSLIILCQSLCTSLNARPSLKGSHIARNAHVLHVSEAITDLEENIPIPYDGDATSRRLEGSTALEENTVQIGATVFLRKLGNNMAMALSGSGRFMVIGGIQGDGSHEMYNSVVRVMENKNGLWKQVGNDIVGDNKYNRFGWSVAISCDGSTIAVGSERRDSVGQMQVYRWDERIWSQVGGNGVVFPLPVRYASPPNTVSLSGDGTVVVFGWIGGIHNVPGQIAVYKWNGIWQEMGNFEVPRGDENVSMVALSEDGSVVAVSAAYGGPDSDGSIMVYHWDGYRWIQLGSRILGEAQGKLVSMDISSRGNILAAGGNGYVKIFELKNGDWQQLGDTIAGKSPDYEFFVSSISISGDGSVVSVGASEAENEVGHVRLFQFNGTQWRQLIEFQGESWGTRFGYVTSISKDGSTVAVGGVGNAGHGTPDGDGTFVKVYSLDTLSSSNHVCIPSVSLSPTPSPVARIPDDSDQSILTITLVAGGMFVLIVAGLVFIALKHARALSSTRQAIVARRNNQQHASLASDPSTPGAVTPAPSETARYEQLLTKICFQTVLPDKNNIEPESLRAGLETEETRAKSSGESMTLSDRFASWIMPSKSDECCICLEGYHPGEKICVPATKECNHVFHQECLAEWLLQGHDQCPLCRVDLMK